MSSPLLLSLCLALSAAPGKPKLVVLDLTPSGGIEAETAGAITEAVVSEVASRGIFSVVSSKEIQALLGLERQKQMLGCSDSEASSCLTELAGAMGAAFMMRGSLAKLGHAYQLTLQTLDPVKAQPLGRSIKLAKDLVTLRSYLPFAVAEATATPLPPPPSRLLPYSLIGGGAVALLGGGLIGLDALSRERAVSRELDNGALGVLGTRSAYESEAAAVGAERTVALAAILVGGALVGSGVWLMPADLAGGSATLVPAANGLALVGSFP